MPDPEGTLPSFNGKNTSAHKSLASPRVYVMAVSAKEAVGEERLSSCAMRLGRENALRTACVVAGSCWVEVI